MSDSDLLKNSTLMDSYAYLADRAEEIASLETDKVKRLEFEKTAQDLRANHERVQQILTYLENLEKNEQGPEREKIAEELEQKFTELRLTSRRAKRLFEATATANEKMSRAERLSELFDKANGKTQANLARFCNVTAPAVVLWVRNGAFTYDNAVKIANYFGVNPEWLYSGHGDKFAIPVVHEVSTATDRFAVLDVEIRRGEEWWKIRNATAPVAFNQDFLGSEAIFADTCRLIRVQGDRMVPTIKIGEYVLINEGDINVISGSVYAVSVNGEFLLCQITRITDGVRLHYDNPNYPDEEFTNEMMKEIHIIGRVVMSVRQF